MTPRPDIAKAIAMHFLGTPYRWGGDDPSSFDCSGFVIEILKSVGLLPGAGDWTAAGLWGRFKDYEVDKPYDGCLVFWQNLSGKIIHIEYCISSELSIGAAGGGSKTQSDADAWQQNAYVKIRPMSNRKGIHGFIDPYLSL